jgi:hypothetical protein
MIELESMAVKMPVVEGHPNRVGFRGVLTVVDVASQRAPSGSKGHRVVLTRAAAEAALPSLLGMALDYAPAFDRHDQRRKVGVITSAEIVGRNLEVVGYLYAKDFPEIVEEIGKSGGRAADSEPRPSERERNGTGSRAPLRPSAARKRGPSDGKFMRASLSAAVQKLRELTRGFGGNGRAPDFHAESSGAEAGTLGMSYEVSDVTLADTKAKVWILTHVTFTGAAILRRDKAAYGGTWIELAP